MAEATGVQDKDLCIGNGSLGARDHVIAKGLFHFVKQRSATSIDVEG